MSANGEVRWVYNLLRVTSVLGILWGLATLFMVLPDNQNNPYPPGVIGVAVIFLVGFSLWLAQDIATYYQNKQRDRFKGWTKAERVRWRGLPHQEREVYERRIKELMDALSDETPIDRERIPLDMRLAVLDRDNRTCVWCGQQGTEFHDHNGETYQIDHVIPVTKGGKTILSNLATTCRRCNNSKLNKTPLQYLQYLKRTQ